MYSIKKENLGNIEITKLWCYTSDIYSYTCSSCCHKKKDSECDFLRHDEGGPWSSVYYSGICGRDNSQEQYGLALAVID